MYKICLSGTNVAIEGLESLTEIEVNEWLATNQEKLEEPNEYLDTMKYVVLPIEQV